MKKYPTISNIIRGAITRAGYSMRSLCKDTGIPYSTVANHRLDDPGGWSFREFGAIARYVEFTPEELTTLFTLIKGGELRR